MRLKLHGMIPSATPLRRSDHGACAAKAIRQCSCWTWCMTLQHCTVGLSKSRQQTPILLLHLQLCCSCMQLLALCTLTSLWNIVPAWQDTGSLMCTCACKHNCKDAQSLSACVHVQVYKRTFWTESFVQWSPHGSFLATLHRQGVAIWGGASFSRIHRYMHPGVRPDPILHPACILFHCKPGSEPPDFDDKMMGICCLLWILHVGAGENPQAHTGLTIWAASSIAECVLS